jgi:hypothetical protein
MSGHDTCGSEGVTFSGHCAELVAPVAETQLTVTEVLPGT